jgi:hypothetical protein
MPPKTPSKGSKIISKQSKTSASKSTASTEKKSNKRKREYFSANFYKIRISFIGKETYSIYIYKVLKQVKISLS